MTWDHWDQWDHWNHWDHWDHWDRWDHWDHWDYWDHWDTWDHWDGWVTEITEMTSVRWSIAKQVSESSSEEVEMSWSQGVGQWLTLSPCFEARYSSQRQLRSGLVLSVGLWTVFLENQPKDFAETWHEASARWGEETYVAVCPKKFSFINYSWKRVLAIFLTLGPRMDLILHIMIVQNVS